MIAAAMVGAVVIAAAVVTAGVIFETGYLLGSHRNGFRNGIA